MNRSMMLLAFLCLLTGSRAQSPSPNDFEQLAGIPIREAVLEHLDNVHATMAGISRRASASAETLGLAWPYVTVPYETLSVDDALHRSRAKFFAIHPFVAPSQRDPYDQYSIVNAQIAMEKAHQFQYGDTSRLTSAVMDGIFLAATTQNQWPAWQVAPPPSDYSMINWNIASVPKIQEPMEAMLRLRTDTVFSSMFLNEDGLAEIVDANYITQEHNNLHPLSEDHAFLLHPIYQNYLDASSQIVGMVSAYYSFRRSVEKALVPRDRTGIFAVLKNNRGQFRSYKINGPDEIVYLGLGDYHETAYNDQKVTVDMTLYATDPGVFQSVQENCYYWMELYPSLEFYENSNNSSNCTAIITESVDSGSSVSASAGRTTETNKTVFSASNDFVSSTSNRVYDFSNFFLIMIGVGFTILLL